MIDSYLPDGTAALRTVYLSGPMTGLPDFNYPAFKLAAEEIRAGGHFVFNPAEWWRGPVEDFPVRRAFAHYTRFICLKANTMLMLPGWENSLGATAELTLALSCGLDVFEWRGAL